MSYDNKTCKDRKKEMSNLLFFFVIPSIIFIHFIFKQLKPSKSGLAPFPPGPYPWPIVGNLFRMGKHLHITLTNLAQVHGPLMSLRLGSKMVIVGSSPDAAAQILRTHDRLLSGRNVSNAVAVEGSAFHNLSLGLSDECGEGWKNIKGIYKTELFSAKSIESQVQLREERVRDMLKYLFSKQGQVLKIKEVANACAVNIISNICLSVDLVDYEADQLGEAVGRYIRGFAAMGGAAFLHDLFFPVFGGWKTKSYYNKLLGIFRNMCNSWEDVIKQKMKAREVSEDFVSILIKKGFGDKEINALLMELFSAGTESTTATSEWTLVELLRSPEAMTKLRNELEKVVGQDILKEEHLPQLPYLEACVKETLRLHPPGPLLLPHRAVETCEVMGYTVPKDSIVMVNVWAIARDPKIWNDASSYKPERFLDSDVDYKGRDFQFLPFSSGRRFCPGQPLASRVVPLIVGSLIHTFDWVLPDNMDAADIDMNELVDVAMLKENSLLVTPILRRGGKQ